MICPEGISVHESYLKKDAISQTQLCHLINESINHIWHFLKIVNNIQDFVCHASKFHKFLQRVLKPIKVRCLQSIKLYCDTCQVWRFNY